ncbi:hypothetical protein J6590_101108, partial [Homalodisca vitripennis]
DLSERTEERSVGGPRDCHVAVLTAVEDRHTAGVGGQGRLRGRGRTGGRGGGGGAGGSPARSGARGVPDHVDLFLVFIRSLVFSRRPRVRFPLLGHEAARHDHVVARRRTGAAGAVWGRDGIRAEEE